MAATKTKEKNGAPVEFQKPPDGFEDIGTPDIDGWFKPETGAIVAGQLVGMIAIEDEKKPGTVRQAVLVKLSEPCSHAVVDKEEGVTLEVGKVIAVGIRAKLAALLEYVENKGHCWIQTKHQKSLSKGRKMWEFDVRARGKKGPIPQVATRVASAPDSAMDRF